MEFSTLRLCASLISLFRLYRTQRTRQCELISASSVWWFYDDNIHAGHAHNIVLVIILIAGYNFNCRYNCRQTRRTATTKRLHNSLEILWKKYRHISYIRRTAALRRPKDNIIFSGKVLFTNEQSTKKATDNYVVWISAQMLWFTCQIRLFS